ncbi:MAG TPA: sulfite exporter TauE/SafE family protein [Streptosporangiaceae bacterium]|nr:sulfite exporter TauE/SafE family protein [Streptosporangiaceae bacterium]
MWLGRVVGMLAILALLGAGTLAGVASTVAALASVISYPVLLALGLPPVSANVTNTVALVFTGAGAAAGSRQELAGQRGLVLRLGVLTAAGGAAGAALLLLTPAAAFEAVAPVLIGGASVLLIVQPMIAGLSARPGGQRSRPLRAALAAVGIYVGYFGAAAGILLLTVLTAMLDQPLARVNAVKNVVSGLANAAAAVGFALFGPVRWAAAVPLAAGFLVGGWTGPALVRRLPAPALRIGVGVCGVALAVRLGLGAYH